MRKNPTEKMELLGRLTMAAEELEDIAKVNKPQEAGSRHSLTTSSAAVVKELTWNPQTLFADLSKYILLKNLSCGRHLIEVYAAGKHLGLSLKIKSRKEFLSHLRQAGLEVLDLKGLSATKISVTVRKGITARQTGRSKQSVCYFEAGLLSGMIEGYTNRKTFLKECQCAAVHPSGHCKFVDQDSLLAMEDRLSSTGHIPILPLEQYSEENIRLLTSLATHALTAIESTLLYEKTKRQSLIDNLTGLYNHRHFQQSLRIEIKRTERHEQPLSLIMMDLDNFKSINDRYGHLRGDRVLKIVSRIFVHLVRDIDIVARYGGDEFAVILPQTNLQGAQIVAQRILKSFDDPSLFQYGGRNIPMSISLGVAEKKNKETDAEALIRAADNALLKAKKKGGRQFYVSK